jgi:hypothetical protein
MELLCLWLASDRWVCLLKCWTNWEKSPNGWGQNLSQTWLRLLRLKIEEPG